MHPNHFITEQLEHEDWGECINNVYALPGTEILAEKDLHVNLAVNEYGKGRGVYMNGLPFSFEMYDSYIVPSSLRHIRKMR